MGQCRVVAGGAGGWLRGTALASAVLQKGLFVGKCLAFSYFFPKGAALNSAVLLGIIFHS